MVEGETDLLYPEQAYVFDDAFVCEDCVNDYLKDHEWDGVSE